MNPESIQKPRLVQYDITGNLLCPNGFTMPSGQVINLPTERQPCILVIRELLSDCLYGHAKISDIRSVEGADNTYTVNCVLDADSYSEITAVTRTLRSYYGNLHIKMEFIKRPEMTPKDAA